MSKLSKLSEKQEAMLPVYRDEWLKIGLSTAPIDRDKAIAAMVKVYQCAGLVPPDIYIFLNNPLEGAIGAYMLSQVWDQVLGQVRDQVGGQVRGQVWGQVLGQVWGQVWDQVWDQVRGQVWGQVRGQVWGQVRDQVGGQVRDQVWGQVRDQVWGQVRDQVLGQVRDQVLGQVWGQVWDQVLGQVGGQVGDQVWDQVNRAGYGSHDASWLAFYRFFHVEAGLKLEKLEGLWQAAQHCGWYWPFEKAVIITSKPAAISMKDRVLHAEGQPAIEYEGFRVYAYEGQRIPERYGSLPVSQWDPAWIDQEQNADVRTALLKGIGYDRWIQATGGKTIHEQVIHDLPYALIERQDPTIGEMKFLKMKNPSVPGVFHVEPVAPWVMTCEDAMRWRQIGDKAKDKTVKVHYQFIK